MSTVFQEFELEALPELELAAELEQELEQELAGELGELGELELGLGEVGQLMSQGELEQEQFFGQLAGLARRAAASPALRRIGLQAARSALGGVGGLLGEGELEGELEQEASRDSLYSPYRKVYVDALMEHMAHQAAAAESEQEAAEAFLPLIPMLAAKVAPLAMKALPAIGKMAGLAGRSAARSFGSSAGKVVGQAAGRAAVRLAPRVFQGVMRVAPQLTRGVGNVARTLFRNRRTRPLLRAVPAIARRTTASIARRVARGGTVTPRAAVRTLARQTARTLANPQALTRAYRRGRRLDPVVHRLLPAAPGGTPAAGRASAAGSPGMASGLSGTSAVPGVVGGSRCSCVCGPTTMTAGAAGGAAAAPASALCPACGR